MHPFCGFSSFSLFYLFHILSLAGGGGGAHCLRSRGCTFGEERAEREPVDLSWAGHAVFYVPLLSGSFTLSLDRLVANQHLWLLKQTDATCSHTVLLGNKVFYIAFYKRMRETVFLHQMIIIMQFLRSDSLPVFIFQGSNHLAVVLGDIILALIDSIFVWFISFAVS